MNLMHSSKVLYAILAMEVLLFPKVAIATNPSTRQPRSLAAMKCYNKISVTHRGYTILFLKILTMPSSAPPKFCLSPEGAHVTELATSPYFLPNRLLRMQPHAPRRSLPHNYRGTIRIDPHFIVQPGHAKTRLSTSSPATKLPRLQPSNTTSLPSANTSVCWDLAWIALERWAKGCTGGLG